MDCPLNVVLGKTDCECGIEEHCTDKYACIRTGSGSAECLPIVTPGYTTNSSGNDKKACAKSDKSGYLAFFEAYKVCDSGVLSIIPLCSDAKICKDNGEDAGICSPKKDM